MKPITVFGLIGMFAYAAFVPPVGMSKVPARIEFQMQVPATDKVITAEWENPEILESASAKEQEADASDS